MTNQKDKINSYVLGHIEPEKSRLLLQARLYNPYTESFLNRAGIHPGMKVLDVGSGIGNLSLLVANLVGERGQVIGIDANEKVSQFATQRAREMGQNNVKFLVGDIASFDLECDFDAIIGRLILLHIKDPVALLKRLTAFLRRGGIIAFEEIASLGTAIPTCSKIEYVNRLYTRYFKNLGLELEFGHKLPHIFQEAGLGVPKLDYFAPAGTGPDWPGYKWLAEGIRTHMPAFHQFALVSEAEIDVETLETRIREEAVTNRSVVTILPHIAAWAKRP